MPVLVGVQGEIPRHACVQCLEGRPADRDATTWRNAFETVPSCRRAVLLFRPFRHFQNEIVLGDADEAAFGNCRRDAASADNAADIEAVLECPSFTVKYVFQTLRKDYALQHPAVVECLCPDAQYSFRNFYGADQPFISLECPGTYVSDSCRQGKDSGEVAVAECVIADYFKILRQVKFAFKVCIPECASVDVHYPIVKNQASVEF